MVVLSEPVRIANWFKLDIHLNGELLIKIIEEIFSDLNRFGTSLAHGPGYTQAQLVDHYRQSGGWKRFLENNRLVLVRQHDERCHCNPCTQ